MEGQTPRRDLYNEEVPNHVPYTLPCPESYLTSYEGHTSHHVLILQNVVIIIAVRKYIFSQLFFYIAFIKSKTIHVCAVGLTIVYYEWKNRIGANVANRTIYDGRYMGSL